MVLLYLTIRIVAYFLKMCFCAVFTIQCECFNVDILLKTLEENLMFQRFKITSCAFILCLFALTLMTVTPVFAADSAAFKQCQQIKPNGNSVPLMKQKKNCFKNLAGPRNSPAFKQCQQIKPQGAFQPMKQKKNCFRDLARNAGGAGAPAVTADSAAFVQCQQIKPNGTSVALMKQKKNCFKNLAGPRSNAAFKQCQKIKPR